MDDYWKPLALSQGKTIIEQEKLIAHMQENLDDRHARIELLEKRLARVIAECRIYDGTPEIDAICEIAESVRVD